MTSDQLYHKPMAYGLLIRALPYMALCTVNHWRVFSEGENQKRRKQQQGISMEREKNGQRMHAKFLILLPDCHFLLDQVKQYLCHESMETKNLDISYIYFDENRITQRKVLWEPHHNPMK